MEKIKAFFYHADTGKPRWETIAVAVAFIAFLLWYYLKVANYTPPTTSKNDSGSNGNNGSNNGSNNSGSDAGSVVINGTNGSNITDFQAFANQLQAANTKTYWMGCSGNYDKGERCDNFQEFLKMSDANQIAVANIYKSKFGKTLYADVSAIWACDCMLTSGTLTGKMKERLEQLGQK